MNCTGEPSNLTVAAYKNMLNKKILDLLLESFEENQATERIIHHAKNANEYDLVVKYAPVAAKQAASVGAHIEAAQLYPYSDRILPGQ